MALSIVNNPISIGAQASVNGAQSQLSKTIKALSTGLRINSAADDASGLAVSEKLRGQISGLAKAATNAQDAISMLQTADSAMGSMSDMVQRMRELAIQAGNPGYTTNDRTVLQLEIDQLKEEIDRVSTTTEFNTKKLLNGDASGYWSSSDYTKVEALLTGSVKDGDYTINIDVTDGKSAKYESNIFTVKNTATNTIEKASATTSLTAITSFLDKDGNFVLGEGEDLTIYSGDGKSYTITIGRGDTISSVTTKLNTALQELDLVKTGVTTVTYDKNTGKIKMESSINGDRTNLAFAGSEKLLGLLGFSNTQKSENDRLEVTAVNDVTGKTNTVTTSDGIARGIIDGVDLKLNITKTADKTYNLHIKDNATKAIIGANEGQTLDISIGRLDTVSMGIEGINVANIDNAEKAATKLDKALEQINRARSTTGAQMNRLEYTVTNLNTTRENTVAAESRIRDLDIAQASSDLAAQQVLMQSASAMLAQANLMPSYAIKLIQ